MALYIASLNSGSNGNCYYVGNETEAILVDAGISCRETVKRMQHLGLSMSRVKAVFISHEHSDHIRGLYVLAKKQDLPVYMTRDTHYYSRLDLSKQRVIPFNTLDPVEIGGLSVVAFQKEHDASDPHSFVVRYKGIQVGVFTDLGVPCENLVSHFRGCHAAFLEANYDEEMLENGRYPYHLKQRIRGGKGHLSNRQALGLFLEHRPDFMSHLLLSHLSAENNCPEKVAALFEPLAGNTKVVIASRYGPSEVYRISADAAGTDEYTVSSALMQGSLF